MASLRHKRRKVCESKRKYTEMQARSAAVSYMRALGGRMNAYKCKFCGGWHIGHVPRRVRQALEDKQ